MKLLIKLVFEFTLDCNCFPYGFFFKHLLSSPVEIACALSLFDLESKPFRILVLRVERERETKEGGLVGQLTLEGLVPFSTSQRTFPFMRMVGMADHPGLCVSMSLRTFYRAMP